MSNAKYFFSDVTGLTEKLVGLIGKEFASPFEVNHSINRDVGRVNLLGPASRAMLSSSDSLCGLAGANPAKRGLPR